MYLNIREPLKTLFERKRAIHFMPLCMRASCAPFAAIPRLPAVTVYCVKSPDRVPARFRSLSLYSTRLSHFLCSKRFLEAPSIFGRSLTNFSRSNFLRISSMFSLTHISKAAQSTFFARSAPRGEKRVHSFDQRRRTVFRTTHLICKKSPCRCDRGKFCFAV